MKSPEPISVPTSDSALYRAVWRWHFYAGILVAPFALFLAVTGAIYLWKPQYEGARYRDLLRVTPGAGSVTADAQLAAARAAVPGGLRASTFQPAFAAGDTAQVSFKPAGNMSEFGPALVAYVDPHTGRFLGSVNDTDRFMNKVQTLHGSLMAGNAGSYVVELAASWALVLFLTGLYLAWPRPRFAAAGFLVPRLREKGRNFWRDIHAVPAVWLSFATVFMLVTGLLWTQAAGGWYRSISAMLGQGTPRESSASAHRSELTGWSPPLQGSLPQRIDALASTPPAAATGHSMHPDAAGVPEATGPYEGAIPLDRVIALAAAHQVPTPYVIGLPVGPTGVFSVISDRNSPFDRVFLHVDQYSGSVLAHVGFGDFGYLAQFFSWGIIAHEGRLVGLANQVLGTLAAAGVGLLSVSGFWMWWSRRPPGRLAAPAGGNRLPRPVILGTLALAALLPLLALSLAVVYAAELLLMRRPSA